MKRSNGHSLPKARKNDLVTRQISGELLVYDVKRHKAFCLNNTAASIWKNCNGKRTVADLATQLEKDHFAPVDDKVIWLALDQLEKSNLLQAKVERPAAFMSVSRRSLLRAGIITAAFALPLVTVITAPTAAQAASAITAGACTAKDPKAAPCGGAPCVGLPGQTCKQKNPSQCECAL